MRNYFFILYLITFNLLAAQESADQDKIQSLKNKEYLNKIAPSIKSIEAIDLEGKEFKLDTINTRPFVLNTWSTTCQFCVAEIPVFNSLFDLFKSCPIDFYALTSLESKTNTSDFLKSHPYNFKQLFAPFSYIYKSRLAVGLPTTVFVDSKGKVVYSIFGANADLSDQSRIIIEFKKGLKLIGCQN